VLWEPARRTFAVAPVALASQRSLEEVLGVSSEAGGGGASALPSLSQIPLMDAAVHVTLDRAEPAEATSDVPADGYGGSGSASISASGSTTSAGESMAMAERPPARTPPSSMSPGASQASRSGAAGLDSAAVAAEAARKRQAVLAALTGSGSKGSTGGKRKGGGGGGGGMDIATILSQRSHALPVPSFTPAPSLDDGDLEPSHRPEREPLAVAVAVGSDPLAEATLSHPHGHLSDTCCTGHSEEAARAAVRAPAPELPAATPSTAASSTQSLSQTRSDLVSASMATPPRDGGTVGHKRTRHSTTHLNDTVHQTPERQRHQMETVDVGLMRAVYSQRSAAANQVAPPDDAAPGDVAARDRAFYASRDVADAVAFFGPTAAAWAREALARGLFHTGDQPAVSAVTPGRVPTSRSDDFVSAAAVGAVSAASVDRTATADGAASASQGDSQPGGAGAGNVEAALTRVLAKPHFVEMSRRVVGQFNLGFVVARTGVDLFILDQHACDEKFQFEYLQEHTVLHEQTLLVPRPIDLTASEEMIVQAHADLFRINGFRFAIDPAAGPGQRVRLAAVPFSRNLAFGDEDVRELAALIADAPHLPGATHDGGAGAEADAVAPAPMLRLPKVTAMFASRACRSAIMIGSALNRDRMSKVAAQMAELYQPWNCPHGRPTLRHLVDLSQLRMELVPAGADGAAGV